MTEKFDLYKCDICGNIVQILFPGVGELICCGKSMKLFTPQTDENNEIAEKHIPKIETNEQGKFVKVINHPMNEEHYIQFIEVFSRDKNCMLLKYFYPNQNPEIKLNEFEGDIQAQELCNIHGLWRNNND